MQFWEGGAPLTLIVVVVSLAIAGASRRALPALHALNLPDAMLAGTLGLALGPSVLGWVPIDQDVLELVVYHGLALMFIAVALRSPPPGDRTRSGVRSFAIALPLLIVGQALLGLGLVFAWSALGTSLHPGVGLMVPLGFSQGPGQALALGSAWEATGMEDGAQLGLILASLGFFCCMGLGAPMLAVARRRGWLAGGLAQGGQASPEEILPRTGAGMEPLTRQLAAIAAVYLAVWGVIQLAVAALGDRPQAVATVYGFHFVLGTLIALSTRAVLSRVGPPDVLHTPLLSRIAGVVVDVVTVSAIAAVKIEVVREWWAVVLTFAGVAGLFTAAVCLWLARRCFEEAPFEHALVLFGTTTGTLATGLALLRLIDPELEGPVPSGAVLGAAASLPLSIPLLLLLQVPVSGWPERHPGPTLLALGLLAIYGLALLIAWGWLGGLRALRPLWSIWPDVEPSR